MHVYIPHDLLNDSKINGYQIAVFAFCNSFISIFPDSYLALQDIAYNVCGKNLSKAKESMEMLKKHGYLIYNQKGKMYQIIETKNEKPFLILDYSNLTKIMASQNKYKAIMLKYYCLILANRYYINKLKAHILCTRDRTYFSKIMEEPDHMLLKCESALIKMGLLYCFKSNNQEKTDVYCLPEHQQYAKVYAEYTDRIETSDVRRSLSQKYNMLKKGHKYPQKEIEQIKAYAKRCGKDMSVFDSV